MLALAANGARSSKGQKQTSRRSSRSSSKFRACDRLVPQDALKKLAQDAKTSLTRSALLRRYQCHH